MSNDTVETRARTFLAANGGGELTAFFIAPKRAHRGFLAGLTEPERKELLRLANAEK